MLRRASFRLPPDLNAQAFDLLVKRGKWNVQGICGLGLAPVGLLQVLDNDSALEIRHDLE
jgi:hypothetical protein